MDLYQRYGPALLRKAGRLLGNHADAEDVVQALFVEMLKRGQAVADLAYLYRAVTNRCLNFLRDHANRQRLLDRQDPVVRGVVRVRCDEEVLGEFRSLNDFSSYSVVPGTTPAPICREMVE